MKEAIVKKVYGILLSNYGEQGWWPLNGKYKPEFKKRKKSESERFEVAVGAVLAQNTSWKNAERALGNLRHAGKLGREMLGGIPEKELAILIKPAGHYNQKARKLKEFLKHSGKIGREGMLGIWGFGPETVDSILLYAYGEPVFVVDAYTKRIFSRIGVFGETEEYGNVQQFFQESLPADSALFNEYHALIVEHAKRFCRKKPECGGCPLGKICKRRGIEGALAKGDGGRK